MSFFDHETESLGCSWDANFHEYLVNCCNADSLTVEEISLARNQSSEFRMKQARRLPNHHVDPIEVLWDSSRGLNVYSFTRHSVSIENAVHSILLDSMHDGFSTFIGRGNRAIENADARREKGLQEVIREFLCFHGVCFLEKPEGLQKIGPPKSDQKSGSSGQSGSELVKLTITHPVFRISLEIMGLVGFRATSLSADMWEELQGIAKEVSVDAAAVSTSAFDIPIDDNGDALVRKKFDKLYNKRVSELHELDLDHLSHYNSRATESEWKMVGSSREEQKSQAHNYTIDMRQSTDGSTLFEVGGFKYFTPPTTHRRSMEIVQTQNPFNVLAACNFGNDSGCLDITQVSQIHVNVSQQAEKSRHFSSPQSSIPSGFVMEVNVSDSRDYECNAKKKSSNVLATYATQKRAVDFSKAESGGANLLREYDDQHKLHSVLKFFAACCLRFQDVVGKAIALLEGSDDGNLGGRVFVVDGENKSQTQNEVCTSQPFHISGT